MYRCNSEIKNLIRTSSPPSLWFERSPGESGWAFYMRKDSARGASSKFRGCPLRVIWFQQEGGSQVHVLEMLEPLKGEGPLEFAVEVAVEKGLGNGHSFDLRLFALCFE